VFFRNQGFEKILEPPPFDVSEREITEGQYKGSKVRTRTPFEPEDRLKKVISLNGLNAMELSQSITNRLSGDEDVWSVLPALTIASPLYATGSASRKNEIDRNSEIARKYDPLQIALGVSTNNFTGGFKYPYAISSSGEHGMIYIFGEEVSQRVPKILRASWVAIAIEREVVIRVYSNDFFNDRWKRGKEGNGYR